LADIVDRCRGGRRRRNVSCTRRWQVGTAVGSSASLAAKALLPEGLNAKAKATAVPAKRPSNRDFRIEFSKRPAFPSDQLSAIKVNIRLACRLVLARPAIPTKKRRQSRGFAPQIKQI
jgi:hypothetical protein